MDDDESAFGGGLVGGRFGVPGEDGRGWGDGEGSSISAGWTTTDGGEGFVADGASGFCEGVAFDVGCVDGGGSGGSGEGEDGEDGKGDKESVEMGECATP